MSLETPERIRSLQRKLYCKAKAEPAFRFYLLYDKIHREDLLNHAYALARANAGAPGVDGESFAAIAAAGKEAWLAGLRQELITKTYRPAPVRRVMIPKPGGGERPLGIPTIRDRCRIERSKRVVRAFLRSATYGAATSSASPPPSARDQLPSLCSSSASRVKRMSMLPGQDCGDIGAMTTVKQTKC